VGKPWAKPRTEELLEGGEREMTHSFRLVPSLDVAEVIIWPGREFKREFKSEQTVGELHEIEQSRNFFFHLGAFI